MEVLTFLLATVYVLIITACLIFIAVVVLLVISERKARLEIDRLQREKLHWAPDMPAVERKLQTINGIRKANGMNPLAPSIISRPEGQALLYIVKKEKTP